MRRKLYTRIANNLTTMNMPRVTVRDTYFAVGSLNKRVQVDKARPGKVEIAFVEYVPEGIRVRFKSYKNIKALVDIKKFLDIKEDI